MKLDIKHLAPYLPYELKTGFNLNCVSSGNPDEFRIKELNPDSFVFCLRYCKPFLRPISDLNSVGVEGLTYSEWLTEKYYTLDFEKQINSIEEDIRWINHCDYLFVSHLIEWHFDVFGLIEKGLAIDINTLK